MRKLIVCNLVSLDGFFSGPNGDVSVMPFDNGFSDYNAERLRAADTLLLGRKTFEGFRQYWPSIADNAGQPPLEREIARLNTAIDKIIVTDSLADEELTGWGPARAVGRAKAGTTIADLKQGPGRDILVFGSHLLWNALLADGLVDELHFMIGAGVVGEGLRAFHDGVPQSLRRLEARPIADSNLVLVRYAPAQGSK